MATGIDYSWVSGLNDAEFIDQVIQRNLNIVEIIPIFSYYPVGRSELFFRFVSEVLEPPATNIYMYLRQVNLKEFVDAFLIYARKTNFPSSMLAWLLKEKNLLEHKGFVDLFLESKPSPSDFCWVFSEFPSLKTREYIVGFVLSEPNQYHIDYVVNKLGVKSEWLLDEDEIDKVFGFIGSMESE